MISKELYRKEFETLILREERLIELYKRCSAGLKDQFLIDKLKQMYREELKHLNMVKGFIDKLNMSK